MMTLTEYQMLRDRCFDFFKNQTIVDIITVAYSESHRAYHTLDHIRAMLELLDSIDLGSDKHQAMELAIWFHDYTYSVDAIAYPDNETNSVIHMCQLCGEYFPHLSSVLGDAAVFIIATKKHLIPNDLVVDSPMHTACGLFLDIDLSILSADRPVIDQFDINIRQEFNIYDDMTFASGRLAAMLVFQDRPFIYYSEHFQNLFEFKARNNVSYIVAKWSATLDRLQST